MKRREGHRDEMTRAAPHLALALKPALCPVLPEQALGVQIDDAPVQVITT